MAKDNNLDGNVYRKVWYKRRLCWEPIAWSHKTNACPRYDCLTGEKLL